MRLGLPIAALALVAASGCSYSFGLRNPQTAGIEDQIQAADRDARESRTLSHLAAIEAALSDYVKTEGKIPPTLDLLVPKYLADIPVVDTAVHGHKENSQVHYYPPEVIRDGVVDGARLTDTGEWGYVFNDRQVIVFVDCTHMDSRGKPWYQERGVY